jgi:hypothetical protein
MFNNAWSISDFFVKAPAFTYFIIPSLSTKYVVGIYAVFYNIPAFPSASRSTVKENRYPP